MELAKVRNIGISAHIDSGKTTLSERILFYTGRIHKIEEVKGGGDGAKMDHMELEQERGITITSAATSVSWGGVLSNHIKEPYHVNLIDTPGHVDFTIEVERSLRVLDGAVLVLCAVGGVQSQSLTVDRQMRRYNVPRLAFINKMDRTGADADKVVKAMREKLNTDAVLVQMPIGAGETFAGMIDLVTMKKLEFQGDQGTDVIESEIPADLLEEAEAYRHAMLESMSMYNDEMMELLLSEEPVSEELIHKVIKDAVQNQGFTPVFVGTAFKNKGVQPLLDAVVRYLPSPEQREIKARKVDDETQRVLLKPDTEAPFVGMAFKIVEDPYGQLTFMRVYQGKIAKGEMYTNQRTGRKERFSRIVRMHSDEREEIDTAEAGDIVAIMGIDCASGETYAAERDYCTLESMFVPEPVIKVSVTPGSRADADKMSKALQRFRKEDPTFQVYNDDETNETIICGMGELHLEIYIERMRREYKIEVNAGAPKVSYREAPGEKVDFDYKHKKQTGGSGQYAHIKGSLTPIDPEGETLFEFEDHVVGGRIPKQFIAPVEKGMRDSLVKGPLADYPVVGVRIDLNDGSYHDVDSSERAFYIAAQGCFRETLRKASPMILEPIMKCELECPESYQGDVVGDVIRRRGLVVSTDIRDNVSYIIAEVPLAETFGYATDLRSMTKGQGTFTMELMAYRKVPNNVQEEIIAKRAKKD
ncbi:elongation factor G [Aureliella helgolandensis]|uniref:Elongation factor G n=1 Tax=Aureliella helgolandensis TaxID=2527968 RepID=A0A518G1Y8_9BACT|nr:elongation factor G [Aureliella helgolandensis]QDV22611.1 Elongation factor G [Aureliella helgolandensis]